ncbi:hypothetical protein [Amphritea sp.]|uniref:hypothetical protein n=1 Tax=Amphritea sp. TaxID=1872502 RepID=UPI003D13CDA9
MEVEGQLVINKKQTIPSISAHISILGGISINGDRKCLDIPLFYEYFIRRNLSVKGVSYRIEGNGIGNFSEGPLGHPGDNERNYWPLKSYQLEMNYSSKGVQLNIAVTSEQGSCPFDKNKTLSPLELDIELFIPIEKIDEFLGENLRYSFAEQMTKFFNKNHNKALK